MKPAYERALVQRGDVTLWLSPDAVAAWTPGLSGRPGGPRKFSDHAIETALTLRLVFRLPLRQTEGFLRSVLTLMATGLDAYAKADRGPKNGRPSGVSGRFRLT